MPIGIGISSFNWEIEKTNLIGRGERIRTSDSCVPNAVLYQAELHPEFQIFRIAALLRSAPILANIACI